MSDREALSFDWTFVFYWLMATTAGLVLSWLLVPAIALVAGGVGVAILQALVLFRRFPRAWQWILLSVIGWLAGVAFSLVVIPPGLGFLSGALDHPVEAIAGKRHG